jgi:hypothetical protein
LESASLSNFDSNKRYNLTLFPASDHIFEGAK